MQSAACGTEGSSNVSNVDPEIELTLEVNGEAIACAAITDNGVFLR